jgi:thiamine biosynthesis protein ThiI
VFTPKHPRTRPTLDYVLNAEKAFDWEPMVAAAAENARFVLINSL